MDIAIVASEKHHKIAEGLAEYISNKKGHNAINLSMSQYKLANNNREIENMIIIGDKDENALTDTHLKDINMKHSKAGVNYGFNKNKVILFGEGDLRDKSDLTKMINDLGFSTSKSVITEVLIAFVVISIVGTIIVKIFNGHMGKREGKYFKVLQTQVAADSFVKHDFDLWVNNR
ncbi:hypothetical protein PV797_03955 [Clostridiaceae bacterium M8S5]|nr:hypothetical protein PV797_03955 [Clostridiaceae bacterium M8S5]